MGQSNVNQPNSGTGVGFGPVVKGREIYVVPGTTEIGNKLKAPITAAIALLDVLAYSAEQELDIAAAGATAAAGLAANEAVVNSTGAYGYKPMSGDDLALYKKGKFYLVSVEGILVAGDKLMPGLVTAGAVAKQASTTKAIGFVTKGNDGVAGGPIEAWMDFLQAPQTI